MSCEVVKKGNNQGILLARGDGEFDAVQNTTKPLKHSGGCYFTREYKNEIAKLFKCKPD
jgi:hypothetical protein